MLDYSTMSDREIEVQLAERLFGLTVRPATEEERGDFDFDFFALVEPENPQSGWWTLPEYLSGWDGAEMVAGALTKLNLTIGSDISADLSAVILVLARGESEFYLIAEAQADNFSRALGIAALKALDELQPRRTLADALVEAGVIEGGEGE